MPEFVKLSPATIQLQAELASGFHPTLTRVLALCEDIEEKMSVLATHCDIPVDGHFKQAQWDKLCDDITRILREEKREEKAPLIIHPYH